MINHLIKYFHLKQNQKVGVGDGGGIRDRFFLLLTYTCSINATVGSLLRGLLQS